MYISKFSIGKNARLQTFNHYTPRYTQEKQKHIATHKHSRPYDLPILINETPEEIQTAIRVALSR